MLSVNHNINRRRYDSGIPIKRVTLAQLRTKEKMAARKEAEFERRFGMGLTTTDVERTK